MLLTTIPRGLAALVLACLPLAAQASGPDSAPGPRVVDPLEPHLVVRLLPGVEVAPLADALGAEVLRTEPDHGIHLLDVDGATADQVQTLAWALKGVPTVLYASADQPTDPPETEGCGKPEGSVAAQQCTIAFIDFEPAETTYTEQYALGQIRGAEAHGLATGVPLVVAVIDTGLDLAHPLFAGRIAPGGWDYIQGTSGGADVPNGLDEDGDGWIDEGVGHGTHVAGLTLLADPAATILPLRVLDSEGNGSAFLVANAIYDAVDAGASVVNLSLSTRTDCDVIAEAIMYAEYHGVTVVSSAGNSGGAPDFPGDYVVENYDHITPPWLPAGTVLTGENMIVASSVDPAKLKPDFACYGPTVDVAAAGYDVYSAMIDGQYAWWTGTSMTAGLVSGATSYLLSIWGQGSYSGEVQDLLTQTAEDLDGLNPAYAGGLGAGLVDLEAAAEALLGS